MGPTNFKHHEMMIKHYRERRKSIIIAHWLAKNGINFDFIFKDDRTKYNDWLLKQGS